MIRMKEMWFKDSRLNQLRPIERVDAVGDDETALTDLNEQKWGWVGSASVVSKLSMECV